MGKGLYSPSLLLVILISLSHKATSQAMTTKTLTFTQDQLWHLLDAMEGYDVVFHSDGDEEKIKGFDKLYKRVLKAYQKIQ